MSKGKVYLVGAGPGDAELITVKGLGLIAQADIVVYDFLIPAELLTFAKADAELISVGKSAGKHTLPQVQINELLVEKAKQGNIVIRLKGGDPFLFGRGGEELQACTDAGIDFEVVPGITSALAAPCYAGIPATHRDFTSNIAVVTGHRKAGDTRPIEIPKAGTVIFLMGVGNIRNIVSSLIGAGWPEDSQIAAIERGTCYDQRVITGKLKDFCEVVEKEKVRPPTVFIVGKVIELQEKLDWFTRKPNILVLGNHPERYRHLGNIVHRRIIDCVPIDNYRKADAVLNKIAKFDWIIFTSANGIKFGFERLYAMGVDVRVLSGVKVAAIGRATANRLTEYGILADMVPEVESSAGLLEVFDKLEMNDKKVLLLQAEVSSKELSEGLLRMNAVVEKVAVYKTVQTEPGDVNFDYIDQVLFTSGSTARAFARYFGKVPDDVKAYCLGPATLNEVKKLGINAELLPGN
jgi:uroporphyrinogen III methyltransferase/synthase